MAGFWQGSGDDGLGEPLHYYGANGKNVADIINGKLAIYDHNNFDAMAPDVQSMLQQKGITKIATPQEVDNLINEDAPGNGAGKGSMKEGILSALAFAATAGTAGGAFSGMGSAPAWYTEGLANGTIAAGGAEAGGGLGGWFGAGEGVQVAGNATGIGSVGGSGLTAAQIAEGQAFGYLDAAGNLIAPGAASGGVAGGAAAGAAKGFSLPSWVGTAGSAAGGVAALAGAGGGGNDSSGDYQDFGYEGAAGPQIRGGETGMGQDYDEYGNLLPGAAGTDNTFPTGSETSGDAWNLTADQVSKVKSALDSGIKLEDALKLAGLAAPVIGSLLSSRAIKEASAAQQAATDAGIARINATTPAAQAAVTAAQQTGAAGQTAALQATIQRLQQAYETGTAAEKAAASQAIEQLKSQYGEGVTGQNAALNTTLDALTRQYDTGVAGQNAELATARGNLKPYTDAGAAAVGNLAIGTAPGGDLVRRFAQTDLDGDPVYQNGLKFGLDQGTAGINARAMQAGGYDSGATLKALTRFGNDYGTTKSEGSYNRYTSDQNNTYNKLMGVTGVGQNATNAGNTLGFNTASNIAAQGNTMAVNAGNFRGTTAANIAGQGNTMAGNIGQIGTSTATNIANQGNTMANQIGNYETGTAGSIANSLNTAATNNANIGIGANNNIVQLLTSMGNARGAASIATGNNFSNAATGIGNTINSQSILDKLLAGSRKVA